MEPQREHTSLTARDLRVPVPEDSAHHFATVTVVLHERVLLTSWVEGRASYRLGILDLRTGQWDVMSGLRGTLRAALGLSAGRALLLTEHALTEIDLSGPAITRQLTAKIGKHNTYLRGEDNDIVALGNARAPMESLVSLTTLTVAKRRRRGPNAAPQMPAAVVRAGGARILAVRGEIEIVATETRDSAPQRLLLLTSSEGSEPASVDFSIGLQSAHLVADGVIAAGPDIGQERKLTVIPGVMSGTADSAQMGLEDLVSAANESAEQLLSTRARRNPPRTVFRDRRLEPGETVSDVAGQRVTLVNCVAGRSTDTHERPRIVRAHLVDLELQASSLNGAVFEDITIDGLRCTGDDGFLFGCEFRRVTLSGRIRGLVLNSTLDAIDPEVTARHAQWYRERLEDPEWMLDLTEATGDIEIRGYPSRFIRRNPNLQAVVTAAAVREIDWRSIEAGRSALRVSLDELARSDWEDVTLIADPHSNRADDDLRYIARLRDAGIALPD